MDSARADQRPRKAAIATYRVRDGVPVTFR
jgi:hypothetical protein